MTRLDPRRILACDHDSFEEVVERDLSYPLPLHPRCPVTVRDDTKLVSDAFQFADGRLCVLERGAVRRIDSPVLKRWIVDAFWVHPLQPQFLEQCLPPYI